MPKVVGTFPGVREGLSAVRVRDVLPGKVPGDAEGARHVVQAFLDLYAQERGWQVLQAFKAESEALLGAIWDRTFETVDAARVDALLRERRFVILQGPPGTGKTRLAEEVRRDFFGGRGITVQFHPAVTYEDFVVGLSPDAQAGSLRFGVRPGWLIEAARVAKDGPAVLVLDEINRADLAKVLGEAVFLFEPGEVGGASARTVRSAHAVDGAFDFRLPEGLYVLGTMNTADRSIAAGRHRHTAAVRLRRPSCRSARWSPRRTCLSR